jgi:hypothetical protein
MPTPALRFECRSCPVFGNCRGKDVKNHVFEIPRLSEARFNQLQKLGIENIEEIPYDFPLTDNQSRVRKCVRDREIFIGPELSRELQSISWPAYYLDFETVNTAIPLYEDIAPYTQLPTQYSLQKCSAPGKVTDHFEYLSDPRQDSRRELARNLIGNIGNEGSIITYSNYEKTILKGLSMMDFDLSYEIESVIERIVDLGGIIAKHYYHPDFHGSTSLKVTLPVCVPSLTYDDLEIKEGDSAGATFAYLALGRFSEEEGESVRKHLLRYCERDTLALVKLHEHLVKSSSG